MAAVRKLGKVQSGAMVPHVSGDSIWWEEERIEPHSYACLGCGNVWSRKWQAETCEDRGHVASFAQRYGGFVENGIHKGSVEYTRQRIDRINPERSR